MVPVIMLSYARRLLVWGLTTGARFFSRQVKCHLHLQVALAKLAYQRLRPIAGMHATPHIGSFVPNKTRMLRLCPPFQLVCLADSVI